MSGKSFIPIAHATASVVVPTPALGLSIYSTATPDERSPASIETPGSLLQCQCLMRKLRVDGIPTPGPPILPGLPCLVSIRPLAPESVFHHQSYLRLWISVPFHPHTGFSFAFLAYKRAHLCALPPAPPGCLSYRRGIFC